MSCLFGFDDNPAATSAGDLVIDATGLPVIVDAVAGNKFVLVDIGPACGGGGGNKFVVDISAGCEGTSGEGTGGEGTGGGGAGNKFVVDVVAGGVEGNVDIEFTGINVCVGAKF